MTRTTDVNNIRFKKQSGFIGQAQDSMDISSGTANQINDSTQLGKERETTASAPDQSILTHMMTNNMSLDKRGSIGDPREISEIPLAIN